MPDPYTDKNGKPILRDSVVAFVDILGFSEYCKESFNAGNGQIELDRLNDALANALKFLKAEHESGSFFNIRMRTFTDCLVVGLPFPDRDNFTDGHKESYIVIVSDYLAYLQGDLIKEGYLVRGGITSGEICITGDIVFGPALIEAYEEEKKAVYPRIVLNKKARALFQRQWNMTEPIFNLCEDSDGQVFVDFLEATVMIAYPDDRPFTEYLEGSNNCITENLKKYSSNLHVRAKYEWSATYHNSFCKRHNDILGNEFLIDIESLIVPPRPWLIKNSV
jgi:hypothetical protein